MSVRVDGFRTPYSSARGATLLEVLIAVVVLAIGMLGFAALQSTSLQSGHSSFLRSQATFLAYEIGDRMRANRENLPDYDTGGFPISPPACDPTLVATGTRAARDVGEWLNEIACRLRDGNGRIDITNGQALVFVQWNDSRGNIGDGVGGTESGSQANTQTFVFRMEP